MKLWWIIILCGIQIANTIKTSSMLNSGFFDELIWFFLWKPFRMTWKIKLHRQKFLSVKSYQIWGGSVGFRIRVNLCCANTSNFNLFSCGSNLTKLTFCLYSIVNPTNTTDPFSNRCVFFFFLFWVLQICIFALEIFYSIFPPENWHLFSFATSSFFEKETIFVSSFCCWIHGKQQQQMSISHIWFAALMPCPKQIHNKFSLGPFSKICCLVLMRCTAKLQYDLFAEA